MAVPVKIAGNSNTGVLGAHLHWHWVRGIIEASLDATDKKKQVEVLIADERGEWLLKPPAESAANLVALKEQTSWRDYFSAETRIQSSPSQQGLGWVVVVRASSSLALADIHQTRLLMLWLSLIFSASFAAVAWFISARVVRPIEALADQARAHQNVRSVPADINREPPSRDEAGMLGQVMHELAFYDRVTGLVNRRLLMERLEMALSDNARTRNQGGLILINLDHFSFRVAQYICF